MLQKIWSGLQNPKIQKILVIILVIILAVYIFKKVFTVGTINQAVVGMQAASNISSTRRYELDQVADGLYASMDGAGTYYNDWEAEMRKIKNDDEFRYVVASFGEREGSNLTSWIGTEVMLSQGSIQNVNSYFASLGMTSRV